MDRDGQGAFELRLGQALDGIGDAWEGRDAGGAGGGQGERTRGVSTMCMKRGRDVHCLAVWQFA